MEVWLGENAYLDSEGVCREKNSNLAIRVCVPMHTFGHPVDLDGLAGACSRWGLRLVEDAAESLGSYYYGQHTGTFGIFGALSFNGNKILTTGGGGAILTSGLYANRAKHITTTAKIAHPYEYFHDEVAYNYRMPNLNAALGCGQLEKMDEYLTYKRELANQYCNFFMGTSIEFVREPKGCRSNYWLNAVICSDRNERDEIIKYTNQKNIMTRPIWILMNHLPMFQQCLRGSLKISEWLADRVVNLPSGVIQKK
jgi:dTDP-4-amino-4,6-dideoxygalactose transaminase